MKLKFERTAILDALQTVQGIVTARTTLPILSNALIHADKKNISITTTDIEVSVRCGIGGTVLKAGATTVPVRKLSSIMKELAADEVEMDVDEKNVATIQSGSSLFKIIGLGSDEFPALPVFDTKLGYMLDQGALKQMLKNVAYGASTDETRYVLNGVFMSFKGDKLTMVATDGRRLALVEEEVEFPKEAEVDLIIPTKVVTELVHSLGDEGQVKIYTSGNQVAFEFRDILIVSKLIEGTYPNFRQVIPAQSEERVVLERELLLTALRRAALLASDKSNSVRLEFSKNTLKITAITPEVGEAHETAAIKYDGKDIAVAFNPEYLMDPLRQLTTDEVYLEITDELSPGVLKCEIPFLYVLMPMRIT